VRHSSIWLLGLGTCLVLVGACGSSENTAAKNNKDGGAPDGAPAPGSGGVGGESGSGAAAGKSGSGGVPGGAGTSSSAGSSGAAGAGGTTSSDGGNGNGGASAGGTTSDAGKGGGSDAGTSDAGNVSTCATNFADCDHDPNNGCETSLTTENNCGACGRDCTIDGATCSAGLCGIVQLFSAADMPFGTDNGAARSWAFDATTATAFWVGFNDYSVRAYPLNGTPARLVWQPASPATAGTESIAVTGGNVYWSIGGATPTVFEKAVGAAASVAPTQAFHPVARTSFFRVEGTSFYWATGDYQDPTAPAAGYVYKRSITAPATDGGTAIVTVDQGNFDDFKAFQPTSDALYWISDNGTVPYEIRTTPLTGGTPKAVPAIAGAASTAVAAYGGITPAFYAVGNTLYFNRALGTSPFNGIYRFATGDAAPTQLVKAEGVTSLIVDGTAIYFLLQNSNNVFKAPLAGGAPSPVTNATGYKLIAQDAKYLYLLQSASGSSTLAKVIK
jgi:hypothetical protein